MNPQARLVVGFACFGHFQQATFVHILHIEPNQCFVDGLPMLAQKIDITAHLVIEIVADNVPKIGIHRPCIFGADIAVVGVDIELNHATFGLIFAHGFQRSAGSIDQRAIATGNSAQKDNATVACPHLRIASSQSRSTKASGGDTAMDNF